MARSEILDHEVVVQLLELSAGAPDLLTTLATTYWTTAGEHLATLRETIGNGDVVATSNAAHALKGSSLTVGAARPAALAETIEAEANAGRLPALDVIDGLESDVSEAVAEIRRLVDEP